MRFQFAYLKLNSLVCFVLLLAFISPSLTRAEAGIDKETAPEVLTLEKAIEYAINADTQVKISQLTAENSSYSYQLAKWSAKKISDDSIDSFEAAMGKDAVKSYPEMVMEFSYLQQKQDENAVAQKTTNLYNNLIQAEAELELVKQRQRRLEFISGIANRLNKTTDLSELKARQDILIDSYQKAVEKVESEQTLLNELLKVDFSKKWILTSEKHEKESNFLTEEQAIEVNMASDPEILRYEIRLEYELKRQKIIDDYSRLYTFVGRIKQNEIKILLISLDEAKKQARETISQGYKKWKELYLTLEDFQNKTKAAAENFQQKLDRYSTLRESITEVFRAEEELSTQETGLQKALNDERAGRSTIIVKQANKQASKPETKKDKVKD
ncbi:hypothetical protein [Brevibacillus reuszeri]|uniref:hypothetical protein n=1 Tax=Brevibacillus reuszeri TaxID=54915 RepID=UPI0028A1D8D4|nr:hypothetical protein [Brevibacillus reuszeri]